MSKIYKNVTELIGHTPLLKLSRFLTENKIENADICAKLEYFNPSGSAKDRVAWQMVKDALESGKIDRNSTIIEPTSGNTGIGLASVTASLGMKCVIVMPDTMSMERRLLMKAYGAELVLTDGKLGMAGSIDKAMELNKEIEGSFVAGQFTNESNPKAHFQTTGSEIWEDTDGEVDIYVASVGTGGTLTGTARYLKSKNPNIKVFAVEPSSSPLLSGGKAGAHKIQGIGANFIPKILDRDIIDEVITITDDEAFETTRAFAKAEGVLLGISSGAAICAAIKIAKRAENANKKVVVVCPDTGERYLTSNVF